ncbi:MAG: ribonuclease P protein component [Alphaproteobacteria bacterium]|nr:ribonuclease P protein component [Alphaproteobacteria bacterium]
MAFLHYTILKRRASFVRLSSQGKRFQGQDFILQVLVQAMEVSSFHPICTFGITCSRKVGGAVQRNLAKRRIRSVVLPWLKQKSFPYSIAFNVIARSSLVTRPFSTFEQNLLTVLDATFKKHDPQL